MNILAELVATCDVNISRDVRPFVSQTELNLW